MCGINGILRFHAGAAPVDREELLRTREAMSSRGPDGTGLWVSADGDVGLGHRRLAIIDLSDAGRQPMSWAGDRYRIVFNGEIYNYRDLRASLVAHGVRFESHSDTEVILAMFEREGPAMLTRLRGMFALAIWDEHRRTLLLARDPYGIKPLYIAETGGILRFASQVKALEAGGALPGDIDPAGLVGFLLWGSVPEPRTLLRAVRSMPAGTYVVAGPDGVAEPVSYHRFAVSGDPEGEPDAARALERSVRLHLESDVPVAVFLSAGLDSSLIAALTKRASGEPPSTLTLRFDRFEGTPRDEAPLAAEVAKTLGARHVERRVRREDFLDLWPRALAAMDQPSIDGFNTFVISRVAHEEGFKVVLSGLGGDELMGSYMTFRDIPRWRALSRVGGSIPGLAAAWPPIARTIAPDRAKLRGFFRYADSTAGAYFLRRGLFLPEEVTVLLGPEVARTGLEAYDPLRDAAGRLDVVADRPLGDWEAVHRLESTMYMRNQLLRDSDWASMAHSLELRVPLVDAWLQRDFAAARFEPARSEGKAATVRRAAPELPDALWNRPKTGFSIPVLEWLEEDLDFRGTAGQASRRLALRVLQAFGVDLPGADLPSLVAGSRS